MRSHERDDSGRLYFQFLTDTVQEVGHHLLKAALFHWSRNDEREFSGLHAALYRLTQHPLDALLDAKESREALKAQGWLSRLSVWFFSNKKPTGVMA